MSRKDYVKFAQMIFRMLARTDDKDERATLFAVARSLADILSEDNPRFDRDHFLAACGVQADNQ